MQIYSFLYKIQQNMGFKQHQDPTNSPSTSSSGRLTGARYDRISGMVQTTPVHQSGSHRMHRHFAIYVDQHVCIDPHIWDLLSRRQLFTPHQIGLNPHWRSRVEWIPWKGPIEGYMQLSQRAQLRSPLQETRCRDLQVFTGHWWSRCKAFGFESSQYTQPPGLSLL